MNELVKMILQKSNENNKEITLLSLNKIMYFLLAFMVNGENGLYKEKAKEIFEECDFQAWPYGPVEKNTFERFKYTNGKPINEKIDEKLDLDYTLNFWIDELLKINTFNLVRLSQNHDFWKDNEELIRKGHRPKYEFKDFVGII